MGAKGRAGGGQLSCQELRVESIAEGEQAAWGQSRGSHECGQVEEKGLSRGLRRGRQAKVQQAG